MGRTYSNRQNQEILATLLATKRCGGRGASSDPRRLHHHFITAKKLGRERLAGGPEQRHVI